MFTRFMHMSIANKKNRTLTTRKDRICLLCMKICMKTSIK